MAQALPAAFETIPEDRAVHVLDARFLRPVDSAVPVDYVVDDASETRSFSRRAVRCEQSGKAMLELSASFVAPLACPTFQLAMPEVPPPETLAAERVEAQTGRMSA